MEEKNFKKFAGDSLFLSLKLKNICAGLDADAISSKFPSFFPSFHLTHAIERAAAVLEKTSRKFLQLIPDRMPLDEQELDVSIARIQHGELKANVAL